ncbi:MAG: homocysteine S-methyltransferase family protein [Acidobacteriota bacterium]
MAHAWKETLDGGNVLLIDGGMGTELQRRGVPMDQVAWSGAAVLTHPDTVRETHEDYIRAGAQVIITNTFGSTRQMLEPAGYGDQVESVLRGAVKLARQARDNVAGHTVAVAGSISTEPPGFDRDAFLSPDKELEAYREAAGLLADAGVDLIALEMIVETVHASLALEAALEAKLPLWLGIWL